MLEIPVMTEGLGEWLALAFIVAVAGVLRGLTGFGAAMVMAPAIAIVLGARDAIALSATLNALTLVQLFVPGLKHARWSLVVPITVAAIGGFLIGLHIFLSFDPKTMKHVIGVVGIIGALFPFLRIGRSIRYGLVPSISLGTVAGLGLGTSGIGGPFVPLYVLTGEDTSIAKRATIIVYSGFLQLAAVPVLFASHVLTAKMFFMAVTLLPVAIVATHVGTKLFHRTDEVLYERISLIVIVAVGLAAAIL